MEDKPVMVPAEVKDPEDEKKVLLTVNKEPMWDMSVVKCPTYYDTDSKKLADQTPPYMETNWLQLG